MPVWHVSVARINKTMTGIIPVGEWPNNVRRQARELQERVLRGVGGQWEVAEEGVSAVHLRRRLSPDEMRLLYSAHPMCPVFTHGEALKVVLA
jgi:hypothetical protein